MKFINLIIFVAIFMLNSHKILSDEKVLIKLKIDNEIITNFDLEREKKYLSALNPNLKNISDELQIQIAKDSISKEIIKKNELKKYFDLKSDEIEIEKFIKNFFVNLGFNNKIEFESYLIEFGWTLSEIEEKIKIEVLWNQFIFEKYQNQIKIDLENLKSKIKLDEKNKFKTLYDLSEIIFQIEKNKNFTNTLNSIETSILEIGFENTANLYSVSDSAKIGGKIGWVNENSLSSALAKTIKTIQVGNYTQPIKLNNGFIILKINNKKNEEKIVDVENELKKLIKIEETKQLNNFSKIYFDKVKINTKIYEY
jgi:peptidyl-prolyl cis-trans isomerase SurA